MPIGLQVEECNHGDLSDKPGWIRLSLHPTMTDEEAKLFLRALNEIVTTIDVLKKDYMYTGKLNEYIHKTEVNPEIQDKIVRSWFKLK